MPENKLEPATINDEISALDRHIFQLWGTLTLVSVALTLGMGIVVLPEYLRSHEQGQPIPQLVTGLILLVSLLNAYLWKQRRVLLSARETILRERTRREIAEAQAVLDPLTDSFNRRYMETVIAKEVSRADRLGTSLVFLMIDVDDFKTVNTRFGHGIGDRVLRDVAELLKQSCRLSDTIVRYGGDEFLVLLGGSTEQEAQVVLRRIQERVAAWNKNAPMQDYTLGLSCGISSYARGMKVNEIIDDADKRMYEGKSGKMTRAQAAGCT